MAVFGVQPKTFRAERRAGRPTQHPGRVRSCVHETMKSECESHIPRADRERGAAESNCVAARRGGEQLEAEGWSRTKVNSIRHVRRASLRAKGEACRVSGERVTVRELSKLDTRRLGCGWSENDRKVAWCKWGSLSGCQEEGLTEDRASVVVTKPGNAGGAKGRK